MTVFCDTSAFYAAADDDDQSSERARAILATADSLLTSDHVVLESWLLIERRLGWSAAERFLRGIRSGVAAIEFAEASDLEAAAKIGRTFGEQRFSLTDRTSFAIMERLGIVRVATFDDDFAIYRFGRRRSRAFEVLR